MTYADGGARRCYRAFGRCLSSTIEFPELTAIDPSPPAWTFDLASSSDVTSGGGLLGSELLYGSIAARLYRHPFGYRIEVDDTGVYEIAREGSAICWLPNAEPWWDFGRGHFLGRVLATAMHFSGLLVLHGSAVEVGDGVIAFLGTKGTGKTTLALGLVAAGARLVTDDTLPIDAAPEQPFVWPGIHSLRLKPDMVATSAFAITPAEKPGRDGKYATAPLRPSDVLVTSAPLRAVYLVQPATSARADRVVEAASLDPIQATVALTAHAKIGRMLGTGEASVLMDRAGEVASSIPVAALAVHRDLDRLADVAAELLESHGGAPARSASA